MSVIPVMCDFFFEFFSLAFLNYYFLIQRTVASLGWASKTCYLFLFLRIMALSPQKSTFKKSAPCWGLSMMQQIFSSIKIFKHSRQLIFL